MDLLIAKMISTAHNSLHRAYAPYSKFLVASCILTANDALYVGVNVENSSFGLTLCAEATAISNMIVAGEQQIKSMVILAETNELCAPCGACRQRIKEFSSTTTRIHLCTKEAILHSLSMDELLPLAFHFKP